MQRMILTAGDTYPSTQEGALSFPKASPAARAMPIAGARWSCRAGAAVLALVLGSQAFAQGLEVEGDEPPPLTLELMQEQIDELREKLDHKPNLAVPETTMKFFGRIQIDASGVIKSDAAINAFETGDPTDDPENNIEFRRSRFGFSGKTAGDILYKTEIDYAHPNGLAFKDMFFGFEEVPHLGKVLIGNQKRPYGLDALNSSRYNVMMERPFINDTLNRNARRLGAQAYGVSEDKAWNWQYGLFHMTDVAGVGKILGDAVQPEVAGRLAHTAWYDEESGGRNYGHIALSGSLAFPDEDAAINAARFNSRPEIRTNRPWITTGVIDGADSYVLGGLEGVANFGPTQVVAEYMHTNVNRLGGGTELQFHGGYLMLAHFLTGEHMPWDRKSGTIGRPRPLGGESGGRGGAWQVAARYSYADFSDEDIYGGVGEAVTLGLNWYWSANARMQLNYSIGSITDRNLDVGGTIYSDGDYQTLGIRLMMDF